MLILVPTPSYANATIEDNNINTFSENKVNVKNLNLKDVENMLAEEGIERDVINHLIEKLRKGETWDSQKEEYRHLKPQIDTPTYKKTVYPDGSVSIEKIKGGRTTALTRNITEVKNVEISKIAFIINAYFYMDYKKDTSSGLALITRQYDVNVFCYGGDVINQSRGYSAAWSKSPYAYVQFQVTSSMGFPSGGEPGKICYLRGYASSDGHWVSYSY